jgi:hypothetical protein
MSTPPPFDALPERFLERRFASADGRLTLVFRRADDAAFPLRVIVTRPLDGRVLGELPARFVPRTDETARDAKSRLDLVQAELGVPRAGPTYTLFLSRPTDDRSRWNGYDFVALRSDTLVEQVTIFPQYDGTPFSGAEEDWDWQRGWWHPYSNFRPI